MTIAISFTIQFATIKEEIVEMEIIIPLIVTSTYNPKEWAPISDEVFKHWDINIHVPEGATPKDGPSAGVTMLTALTSLFTQRRVKSKIAMTGEITLRGKVLPVGGIKEKILAAKRAGIKEIILCEDNRKDIEEIKDYYLKGLTFQYVKEMGEVIDFALLNQKVKNARNLDVKEKQQASLN